MAEIGCRSSTQTRKSLYQYRIGDPETET